jgi:ADP-dependent NAD(P)H-hydrate dehydratase
MSKRHQPDLTLLPDRPVDGHKGTFGKVLVVAGSRGMVGAPALTANAALRGGAGLVTVGAPKTIQLVAAMLAPCATSIPIPVGPAGEWTDEAIDTAADAGERADVLAVGPGLGDGEDRLYLVRALLSLGQPTVLDADAINALRYDSDWREAICGPVVLTPHPGEFCRLTGQAITSDPPLREGLARHLAQSVESDHPFVVVLKGAGTVVTDGDRTYVNDTGNPGMATGGSGDVLTGLLAAFIAQSLDPFDAACLAVHTHGLAGDLAADAMGRVSMTAEDVLAYLPDAIRQVHGE